MQGYAHTHMDTHMDTHKSTDYLLLISILLATAVEQRRTLVKKERKESGAVIIFNTVPTGQSEPRTNERLAFREFL